jgi:hypothetical protein
MLLIMNDLIIGITLTLFVILGLVCFAGFVGYVLEVRFNIRK